MVSKFTRGLLNILTGWIEIPKQIARTAKEDGAGKGATIGFLKGIGMAVARTAAGVLEAGLFFAPFPEDYKPILEPALVFD
ncbi:MAG: exosortase system-associated protein, TIGR04073 family [Planctomycetes bacterium]|nr:exosortase system-associated protein, TIGR04073 family [Planctomycetota bacterium]